MLRYVTFFRRFFLRNVKSSALRRVTLRYVRVLHRHDVCPRACVQPNRRYRRRSSVSPRISANRAGRLVACELNTARVSKRTSEAFVHS